jgi:hypothetical protein
LVRKKESRQDYETVSKHMTGSCPAETGSLYSNPGGYRFYHFYQFNADGAFFSEGGR